MTYQESREWSDKYIPQIKEIVGPLLMVAAPDEIDVEEATDLIVLRARDMRIAARVRQRLYFERYPHEFTIRSRCASGSKTELQKITDGFGDWMFYGCAAGDKISDWYVIDLHAWRAQMIRNQNLVRFGQKSNGDGTEFTWFDIRSFAAVPPILVASSYELPLIAAAND